uniref:Nucleoprotein TPR/MLP1-2 domain-containing protein n=1 Tax=Megaselia scalaris TaxID=36166 RepID=T1GL94_MEGSC
MEIRNLREQNKTVANNLQSAEQKYAHEMMLHSADIQELSKMKEEFSKLQEKLSTSTISDTTKDLYEESKKLWDESKKLLEQEKIELEKRIEDLDHQNTVLHDQLQAWSAKQMAEIEDAKAESEIVTAYKHGEILRKVEMLNAVTDSNRVLREERDTLTSKVKDLSDQLTLAEDEIVPLKEKNRELSTKVDTYMSENTSLRSEAARWRQRANTVLNNKNSEEFKQITTERDNLLKMLNTEKEILKQVNDELQELKSQRTNASYKTFNFDWSYSRKKYQ